MADGKRPGGGAAAKPALPRPAAVAQGLGDLDEVLTKAIGARIKITTASPNSLTLEGTIFTACRQTNLLALNTSSSSSSSSSSTSLSSPSDYHLVPISRIQSFNIISIPSSTTNSIEDAQPPLSRIDLKALKAKEEAAIKKIREKDATKGKGVSKEGQEVFDAIHRTLPCQWHGTSIIVNGDVSISSPYTPENCSALKDTVTQNMVTRIKKVLENERRKIAEKSTASPASGIRKGG